MLQVTIQNWKHTVIQEEIYIKPSQELINDTPRNLDDICTIDNPEFEKPYFDIHVQMYIQQNYS